MATWRFIAGIILIVLNYPLGWGGIVACAFLFRRTRLRRWCFAGSGVYGFSWVMLAAGVYLAGPEGMSMVQKGGLPVFAGLTAATMTGCIILWKVRPGLTILPAKRYNTRDFGITDFTGNNNEFTDPDTGAALFGDPARSGSRVGS